MLALSKGKRLEAFTTMEKAMFGFSPRELPREISALGDLALDLRWTWSYEADELWKRLDEGAWNRTRNPWILLQDVSEQRLRELAADRAFTDELVRVAEMRQSYLKRQTWFETTYAAGQLGGVAYFCMEFGLGKALPLYAGGLGVLAGDFLKTASDLGVPVTGVGLLYQEGYFHQMIDASGWQQEAYPYNDPSSMPIQPVLSEAGGWLRIPLALPGRTLSVRVWQASVGRVKLYLLDTNDPVNEPADRGITGKLYGGGTEMRLTQAIVLGVAGWRVVRALRPKTEVCHLNEGHTAFVVIERALDFASRSGLSFSEALWATRSGNIFTTHTPVAAAFDRYPAEIIRKYLGHLRSGSDVCTEEILALGRANPHDRAEPFNPAYLALRASLLTFGVSRLHGRVSQRIFQPLFPRWPEHQVPVEHITNGVHFPSWDSEWSDQIWTAACGKERWRGAHDELPRLFATVSDEMVWNMRAQGRQALVRTVRSRLARQLCARGHAAAVVAEAENVLNPNFLTLGFARRFAAYKRPNLLLKSPARLANLLNDPLRPVQLVIAGKAHPDDDEGKRLIHEWVACAQRPEFRRRLVLLEDYDIELAQELVQGVDVWLNTPRRPWEACGTSGMKILVNGGLNLSELDGWWEEAYAPGRGWAIGDGNEQSDPAWDDHEAEELYAVLQKQVVAEFYNRDRAGIPRAWVARVRESMAVLSPTCSGARMVREWVERAYLKADKVLRNRLDKNGSLAQALRRWEERVRRHWASLQACSPTAERTESGWSFSVLVYLSEMSVEDVRVELYADPAQGNRPEVVELLRGVPIPGSINGYVYAGNLETNRPASDFTVRIIPHHANARVPAELPCILWQG